MAVRPILLMAFLGSAVLLSSVWAQTGAKPAKETIKADYSEQTADTAARLDSVKQEIIDLKDDIKTGDGGAEIQASRKDLLRAKEALADILQEFADALKAGNTQRVTFLEPRKEEAEVTEELEGIRLELFYSLYDSGKVSNGDLRTSGSEELIQTYLDKCREQLRIEKQKNKLERRIGRIEDEKIALRRELAPPSTAAVRAPRLRDAATSGPRTMAVPNPER